MNQSEIERGRIDAEFYSPQYLDALTLIKTHPHRAIGNFCFVTSGSTPPDREKDLTEGIILLKTVNIQNGFINFLNTPFYINKELDERLKQTRLKPYDVLLNIVGATLDVIGRVTIAPPNFPRANITQAMALIRVNDESSEEFYPEYVFAFLLSKYGHLQIARLARPSGQFNLNHEEVRAILIPKIPTLKQEVFRQKVNELWTEWNNATTTYNKANVILHSVLGISKWKPEEPSTYIKNYVEAQKAGRIDAEYFQPKYDEAIGVISQFNPKKLISTATPVLRTIKPKPHRTYRYIEISDVDTSIGEVGYTEREGQELPPNARIKVKGGELIVSKVRSTRGAVGIVPEECGKNGICSKAFAVFKAQSPTKEFLQVFLRSPVGKLQLEKPSKGSSYPTIKNDDVANVLIPTLKKGVLKEVSTLVQNAFSSRRNAKNLLEEIKINVEQIIEM